MSTWAEKLPDKKRFYSSLKYETTIDNGEKLDGDISDEDYLTCKKIWNEFNMNNVGVNHDHYLKKDVLLLADVFEKFIDTYLKFYKLDPCHSLPLSLFYFSRIEMGCDDKNDWCKISKNFDLYLLHEKGLRRGISTLLKDTAKQITNTPKYFILQNR